MNDLPQPNTRIRTGALLFLSVLVVALICLWMRNRNKPPLATAPETPKIGGFSTNDASHDATPAGPSVTKCLNLAKFFNAGLESNWLSGRMRALNFSALAKGVDDFAGIAFQVGGVIQLSGTGMGKNASRYPNSVEGIPVKMKCAKLHFLHATGWTMPDGSQIGAYIVHFSDGARQEVPIIYGKDICDWWFPAVTPTNTNPGITTNVAAWTATTTQGIVALYKSTWENPHPRTEIKTIDFVSLGSKCAPFLLGITAE